MSSAAVVIGALRVNWGLLWENQIFLYEKFLVVDKTIFVLFLCPATKSGEVFCYSIRNFECLSIGLSALHKFVSAP